MTILDAFKLDRKVALVTGAGQELGQGMAIALAESGAVLTEQAAKGRVNLSLLCVGNITRLLLICTKPARD